MYLIYVWPFITLSTPLCYDFCTSAVRPVHHIIAHSFHCSFLCLCIQYVDPLSGFLFKAQNGKVTRNAFTCYILLSIFNEIAIINCLGLLSHSSIIPDIRNCLKIAFIPFAYLLLKLFSYKNKNDLSIIFAVLEKHSPVKRYL